MHLLVKFNVGSIYLLLFKWLPGLKSAHIVDLKEQSGVIRESALMNVQIDERIDITNRGHKLLREFAEIRAIKKRRDSSLEDRDHKYNLVTI